jgi:hypothetical protein
MKLAGLPLGQSPLIRGLRASEGGGRKRASDLVKPIEIE